MSNNVALWVYLSVTFLLSLIGVVFLVALALRLRSEQIRRERLHSEALVLKQELTLRKAASEVHDTCKPLVSIIALHLRDLDREVPEAQQRLVRKSLEIVEVLILEMQLSCLFLDGQGGAELGLMASLDRIVKWMKNLKPIKCVMSVDGDWLISDASVNLIVRRIALEAIQNVIKHADATELTLAFTRTGQEFKMCIGDNGKGFERHATRSGTGFGFRNMRQRAQLLPGHLSIDSEPGGGTTVCLTWEERSP